MADEVLNLLSSSRQDGHFMNVTPNANYDTIVIAKGLRNSTIANCTNDYCEDDEDYVDRILSYIFPTPFEWCIIVAFIVVFVAGLIGNSLVCIVVWKNANMRNVLNMFIVNLSIADFLVILICLPPTLLESVTETWFMGGLPCKLIKYIQVGVKLTSRFHITYTDICSF